MKYHKVYLRELQELVAQRWDRERRKRESKARSPEEYEAWLESIEPFPPRCVDEVVALNECAPEGRMVAREATEYGTMYLFEYDERRR